VTLGFCFVPAALPTLRTRAATFSLRWQSSLSSSGTLIAFCCFSMTSSFGARSLSSRPSSPARRHILLGCLSPLPCYCSLSEFSFPLLRRDGRLLQPNLSPPPPPFSVRPQTEQHFSFHVLAPFPACQGGTVLQLICRPGLRPSPKSGHSCVGLC